MLTRPLLITRDYVGSKLTEWPDLAKFYHFGKILVVFGIFLEFTYIEHFATNLLTLAFFYTIEQIFFVSVAK